MDGKMKITFTDTPNGVRAYCPKCQSFSLEPTDFYNTPFVRCKSCGFEAPTSIFEIRHERAHGDRALPQYALERLNGKQATTQAHNGTAPQPRNYLFESRPFVDVIVDAAKRPKAEMLFDCLWYENEVAFLFADTGAGKSALAIQIADAISKGAQIQHLRGTQRARKVLYFDFELSDAQQAARYSDGDLTHRFSENFVRVSMRDLPELPPNTKFEDVFMESLTATVEQQKADVVIIDNLTFLRPSLEDSEGAILLMQSLKAFARKRSLSMLILAHSPKLPPRSPITVNSMQGSKQLVSFADAVFAIGKIPDEPSRRYLIQLKCRNAEIVYHSDNVLTATLEKNGAFLGFAFDIETQSEDDLLRPKADNELIENVAILSEQGLSQAEIARKMGVNKMKVCRILKKVNAKPLTTKEPF